MKKTVLENIKALAPLINLTPPQAVFTSTDGSFIVLRELLKATCDDLVKEHPWQFLQKSTSLTTVSGQANYALPADCDYLTALSFYNDTQGWSVTGSISSSQWQRLQTGTASSGCPYTKYRLFGNELWLGPTPTDSGVTINFEYLSNCYATTSGGVPKAEVDADSDVVLFDHRLVIYGVKLKWLEKNGNDTTAALVEFNRTLEHIKNNDVPGAVIHMGAKRSSDLISNANIPDWA